MPSNCYIQVILPLKLDWMPWYSTDIGTVAAGDRVSLRFAGRHYIGVVATVNAVPDIDPERILPIERPETGLERISVQEMELWKFIADYYMCSVGEVFKAAYPMQRLEKEQSALRLQQRRAAQVQHRKELVEERIARLQIRLDKCLLKLQSRHNETVTASLEANRASIEQSIATCKAQLSQFERTSSNPATDTVPERAEESANPEPDWPEAGRLRERMESGKTVLAVSAGQTGLWRALAREQLDAGRSVLVLDSEKQGVEALCREVGSGFGVQALVYHSSVSAPEQRRVADRLRSGQPYLVLGTRSALLLPFSSLGLIVLLNEHDPSYKQDITPRFLGRDLAAVLARIHGARLLLCSETPSLESIANVLSGKYLLFQDSAPSACPPAEIIDTAAEKCKNGMVGNFSRRLLAMISRTLEQGEKVLLLRTWGDVHFLRDEVAPLFPEASVSCLGDEDYDADAQIVLGTVFQSKALSLARIGLVAVMLCDDLFSRTDFRADERALQILRQLQLRRSHHDVPKHLTATENPGDTPSCDKAVACDARNIVIQTSRSSHPVYRMLSGRRAFSYDDVVKLLMQERRDLGLPPYSRIVDILVRDSSATRLHLMASRLASCLRELSVQTCAGVQADSGAASHTTPLSIIVTDPFNAAPWETDLLRIRIILPRGSEAAEAKHTVYRAVNAFEKKNSYLSHIHFDVDPV